MSSKTTRKRKRARIFKEPEIDLRHLVDTPARYLDDPTSQFGYENPLTHKEQLTYERIIAKAFDQAMLELYGKQT